MSFSGVDYQQAFEEACDKLAWTRDRDEVKSELEALEWILWEALRTALFFAAIFIAVIIVAPVAYIADVRQSWQGGAVAIAAIAALATLFYWTMRLLIWSEVTKHVKGRKFGSGGLE